MNGLPSFPICCCFDSDVCRNCGCCFCVGFDPHLLLCGMLLSSAVMKTEWKEAQEWKVQNDNKSQPFGFAESLF